MKKIALVLIAALFVCSFAFAAEEKTTIGKVAEVVVADPVKGVVDNAVTIMDETGKLVTFKVEPVAKISDAALNAITLGQLKKNEKVTVKYTEDQGENKAAAINVEK